MQKHLKKYFFIIFVDFFGHGKLLLINGEVCEVSAHVGSQHRGNDLVSEFVEGVLIESR